MILFDIFVGIFENLAEVWPKLYAVPHSEI